MKYRNPITRELLKEFRRFNKWAGQEMYSINSNQEKTFNKNIKNIVNDV